MWAVALHGGAGDIPRSLPPDRREPRLATLRRCLDLATAALRSGRAALDVVELVVRELENCPHYNAGVGSVLTADGTVEMEAAVMDGNTLRCGAVSGLSTVVNAVSLARLVMEKTPHIYLAFDGAEAFAREQVNKITIAPTTIPSPFCRLHTNITVTVSLHEDSDNF